MKCSLMMQWGLTGLLLTLAPLSTHADDIVAAFSSAAPGYFESRMKEGKLQPQTYVFMQGQYYGGTTRDRSLEKTPFSTVVNRLAIDLKKQGFYPAPSLNQSNLLLLVHWGVTIGSGNDYESDARDHDRGRQLVIQFNDALRQDIGNSTGPRPTTGTAVVRSQMDFEILQNSNDALSAKMQKVPSAMLLGFTSDLQNEEAKLGVSEHQRTLLSLLDTDRYFVVVVAYDWATLVEHRRLKWVWSCRLSIRSPGVNFPIALDRMGQIGGQYFGIEQTELKMVSAKEKRAEVKVGEAIVIEYEPK